MIKADRCIFIVAIILSVLLSCSSNPEQVFVQDQAELLSEDQEQRLSEFQHLLLKERNVHLFIATLDKPATNLDQTALKLFEEKSLGEKTRGARGLLLVIDPQLQQVRIEVGYDLEGVFPDGFIAGLEYDQMLPFFQQNRIGQGIEALTELLVARLMRDDIPKSTPSLQTDHLSGGAGAKIQIRPRTTAGTENTQGNSETFVPQSTPMATLEIYRESLAAGNKNPKLSIYTPESREFFSHWMVTDAQQKNALKTLEQNLSVAEVITENNYAVIRFPVKNRQASPYFLHRSSSGWQLDFVTMSQTIGFNHRNQWHFRVQAHPYSFAFNNWHIDSNGFPHPAR